MRYIVSSGKRITRSIIKYLSPVQCEVKWEKEADPFLLPYKNFRLKKVLGYSRTRNHVFHVTGIYKHKHIEAYIKLSTERSEYIKNEIDTLYQLDMDILPQIIDHDDERVCFMVTIARKGQTLPSILNYRGSDASKEYMYEYGKMLANFHQIVGTFGSVKERPYFYIPSYESFREASLNFVFEYLTINKPNTINKCFCHGDYNYANVLWEKNHISAVLDFELSGIGNKEYDMAWAIFFRPEQQYLKTKEDAILFLEGYSSVGDFNMDYLKYYLVLLYSHIYISVAKTGAYKKYIMNVLLAICLELF